MEGSCALLWGLLCFAWLDAADMLLDDVSAVPPWIEKQQRYVFVVLAVRAGSFLDVLS